MSFYSRLAQHNPVGDWSSESGRARNADIATALMAASLPWSTTAFGAATVIWLIAVIATIDIDQILQLIKRPPWALSIGLFVLAVIGMFWGSAPWLSRIYTLGTMVKLLALPLLVYQFQRSESGPKILCVFYASCIVLMGASWLHRFGVLTTPVSPQIAGVPVKNYITQGIEFTLCIFGSAALSIIMWRRKAIYASAGFALIGAAFLLNLAFIHSSRTALVSLPVLLLILTYRYLGWRRTLAICGTLAAIGTVLWFASPTLRERIDSLYGQFAQYENSQVDTSVGLRLGYWSNSLKFIREAPLLGHGTGSIRGLFEQEVQYPASQKEIVANPHNQTLYFTIEWGALGAILLYAMWMSHILQFTEFRWMAWFGTLIVSQNLFGSMFNSHLSDYVEGWIYVMGVGICAGVISSHSRFRGPQAPVI